jgi:hypothetical protein
MKFATLIVLVAVGLLFSPTVANAIPFRPRGNIDGSMNLTNQTVGKNGTQPYWNITMFKGINATKINGNLTWKFQKYPTACVAGTYITALGDSVTCQAATITSNTSAFSSILITAGGTWQRYRINNSDGQHLRLRGLNGTPGGLEIMGKKSDGTETMDIEIYGKGNGNATHHQKMIWRYDYGGGTPQYLFQMQANGGASYPSLGIDFAIASYDKMLYLSTDGQVKLFQNLLNATKGIETKNLSVTTTSRMFGNLNMTNRNLTLVNTLYCGQVKTSSGSGFSIVNGFTSWGNSKFAGGWVNFSVKNRNVWINNLSGTGNTCVCVTATGMLVRNGSAGIRCC